MISAKEVGILKCMCAITVRMFVLSLYQVADLHPLSVYQCLDASKSRRFPTVCSGRTQGTFKV